jgi:FtsH-binding integral membrane protein
MSDDIEKEKTKAKLENLSELIDRYAQSRSLGLLLFVVLIVAGTLLTLVLMELMYRKPVWWLVCIVTLLMAGAGGAGLWLAVKVLPKYERRLYKKEGQIELKRKKVPILACVLYVLTFLGPVALNAQEIMPTRWALPVALTSLGVFILYASGKERNRPLGVVFCTVLLLEAAATALGLQTPFAGKGWLYSCFVALMIYIAGASLITALLVHIYNRVILHKMKKARPFGEQTASKSDT